MIVVSNNLVLSQALTDAPNADNPIVGWKNVVTTANIAATFADAMFPVINLANPSTALDQIWKSTSQAQQFLTVTGVGSDPVDYLAVAGHNFGSAQIPLLVQGDSGSGFVDLTQETLLPDDSPVIFRFSPVSVNAGIRLRLNSGGIAFPLAAVMYVGKLLVLQRRLYVGHSPMNYNPRSNILTGRSEMGHFLGRLMLGESTATKLDLKNITPEFFRSEMKPWLEDAKLRPWFFAWRPGDYPLETGYCWAASDSQMSNQQPNGMVGVTLDVQGIIK